MRTELDRRHLTYEANVMLLPGRPDIVFQQERLVVFVDGDFWHGYRYPAWKSRLSPYWRSKIERNRTRDRRNHATLRRRGWRVIRVWEHQIQTDLDSAVLRVIRALKKAID
jgi:DNA mismatch endonuclease (patch repair protein)